MGRGSKVGKRRNLKKQLKPKRKTKEKVKDDVCDLICLRPCLFPDFFASFDHEDALLLQFYLHPFQPMLKTRQGVMKIMKMMTIQSLDLSCLLPKLKMMEKMIREMMTPGRIGRSLGRL